MKKGNPDGKYIFYNILWEIKNKETRDRATERENRKREREKLQTKEGKYKGKRERMGEKGNADIKNVIEDVNMAEDRKEIWIEQKKRTRGDDY